MPLCVFLLSFNLTFVWRAFREAKRQRPDFIYQRHSILNIAGLLLALLLRVPFVLEYNSPSYWKRESGDHTNALLVLLRRFFERINLAGASRVLVVSEVLQERLIASGVATDKICVNPNGADVRKFRPGLDGNEVQRRLGLEKKFVVGFSGVYGRWHGVEYLALSIRKVRAVSSEIAFLFMGDENLRRVVSDIAGGDGTTNGTAFVERVAHAEMPAHLAACDVLVSPHVNMADGSRFFGSPVKIFEYMAMGKPIVASRIEQLGQLLVHEQDALLVAPGEPQQIAEAILRLWRDPALAPRLGAAAREKCVRRYTWEHNAQRVIDSFRSLSS